MNRLLQPELLDELPPADPGARRSRADLRRVNAWMGNVAILTQVLLKAELPPQRLVEIGAGDGTLLLKMARRLSPRWKKVQVLFVDRQKLVSQETLKAFNRLDWHAEVLETDLFDWLEAGGPQNGDRILANLFLHHFEEKQLRLMFGLLSKKIDTITACEPRRSVLAGFSARLLGLIGCNHITRHDAVVSVRAGFLGNELSRCWPEEQAWDLLEKRVGLFSHLFHASRKK